MKKQIWLLGGIILLAGVTLAYGGSAVVTNVTDTQFTLSWASQQAESVQVQYGQMPGKLDQTAIDNRGEEVVSTTHHITISGLKPQNIYYYQIISGTSTVEIGQVATGPSLIPTGSNLVYGRVFAGNEPAEGAIVYLTLQDGDAQGSLETSAQMSVLVNPQGYWCAELVNLRTAKLDSLFKYLPKNDDLLIKIEAGVGGQASLKTTSDYAFPTEDIVLK